MDINASPLAAMQPQGIHGQGWLFGGVENGSPRRVDSPVFGPKLERPGPGSKKFFDLEPRLESSPTTSLVADLSQNFHIDKTPQYPTPRRSLFSGLQFGKEFNGRNDVTTPPIPASSPGNEFMDVSPLPHKVPYHVQQMMKSPCAKMDSTLCSSPPTSSPSGREPKTMDPPRRPLLADFTRKRAGISRPGLTRHSRFSGGISFKSQSNHPNFARSSTVPQINLEELFSDASPERLKKKSMSDLSVPPPPKFNMPAGLNGSPVPPPRHRSQRPRGKIRRTISMFEHAEDVMDAEKEEAAPMTVSPEIIDPAENYFLPSLSVKDDPLRRIERSTLCDVLDGKYKEHYDELIIVDCRFEYEYEGGHIAGAININTIDTLEERFLANPPEKRHLVIFHCEYSAHRAPRMALHLRKRDRHLNMANYPNLHYPNVYILQGGYSSFWRENKSRCDPQAYVEMDHVDHKRTCEREMSRFRRNTKFGRAQTFAFGFPANDLDSSPSASLARRPGNTSKDDLSNTPSSRASQRRMASY